MKSENIIRWTIVSVLFLLSVLSLLCLNRQIKGSLFVEPANDSINIVSQRDSISKEIIKLVKLSEEMDLEFISDTTKIAEIESIIKHDTCPLDFIKGGIVEGEKLDSLIKVNPTTKDSINQCIAKFKNQYSDISQTTKSDTGKTPFWYSLKTIILIVITIILVRAFIVSLILFSGILKLFKKKNKMEEIINSTTNMDSVEPENLQLNGKPESVPQKLISDGTTTTTDEKDDTSVNKAQGSSETDDALVPPFADEPAKTQINEKRVRKLTNVNNVIGVSYQGDNHVKATPVVPCQDCHLFTKVNEIWNIAIVSDGAGSKEHSDLGSDAVCAAFAFYLSNMLKTDRRFANGDIPNERIWDLEFRALLIKFQNELKVHKSFKSYDFGSLAATIVILAYSSKGYMFAHVGDGRAGVKVNGEWKSILTPHKGEEANQTIFSTTIEFINKPTLMMSGVFVPETKVEQCDIEAFVLMSDGCEDGAWVTYQRVNLPDGDFKVEDVNQPRPQTLEKLMSILDEKENEQKGLVINFITGYNKGFKTEGDDKTILIGRIK